MWLANMDSTVILSIGGIVALILIIVFLIIILRYAFKKLVIYCGAMRFSSSSFETSFDEIFQNGNETPDFILLGETTAENWPEVGQNKPTDIKEGTFKYKHETYKYRYRNNAQTEKFTIMIWKASIKLENIQDFVDASKDKDPQTYMWGTMEYQGKTITIVSGTGVKLGQTFMPWDKFTTPLVIKGGYGKDIPEAPYSAFIVQDIDSDPFTLAEEQTRAATRLEIYYDPNALLISNSTIKPKLLYTDVMKVYLRYSGELKVISV